MDMEILLKEMDTKLRHGKRAWQYCLRKGGIHRAGMVKWTCEYCQKEGILGGGMVKRQ